MNARTTPTPQLTDTDRDIITRARALAFAGTRIPSLRAITGTSDDAPSDMVRGDALGAAQALLLDLAVIAERLDGDNG